MTIHDKLLEQLNAAALSDEDREAAIAIAADLSGLMVSQVAGEDIDAELVQIKAQVANLAASVRTQIYSEFRVWSSRLVAELLTKALS